MNYWLELWQAGKREEVALLLTGCDDAIIEKFRALLSSEELEEFNQHYSKYLERLNGR